MKNSILILILMFQSFSVTVRGTDFFLLNTCNEGYSNIANDKLPLNDTINRKDTSNTNNFSLLKTNSPIQLSGYTHIRYQHFDQKGDKKGGSYDGFDIHRARLDLKGTISPVWTYRVQLEFSGKGAPKLVDAYGEWKPKSFFIFTVGQFYIPLSLESLTPDNLQESIYRAQAVEALANRNKDATGDNNGRDIGMQISGSFIKISHRNFIDYKLGIFDGAGINITADNNNYKDVGGRLVFHPLSGIDCGTSIYHGVANYGNTATGVKPANHLHNRQGCDLSVKYGNFLFKTEYIQGVDSSAVKRSGYYVQGGYYIIPNVFEVLLKYDTYNPDLDKSNNYDSDYTISLGYKFAANSRVQAAYIYRREHITQFDNNYAVVRFQIGF